MVLEQAAAEPAALEHTRIAREGARERRQVIDAMLAGFLPGRPGPGSGRDAPGHPEDGRGRRGPAAAVRRKGVLYDAGRFMGGDWRPDYDPAVVRCELQIIAEDLRARV
jgi:hypothetical protein